jgi:hypothetical protein
VSPPAQPSSGGGADGGTTNGSSSGGSAGSTSSGGSSASGSSSGSTSSTGSSSSGGLGGTSTGGSGGFSGSTSSGASGGSVIDAGAGTGPGDASAGDSSDPSFGAITFTLIDTSVTNGAPVAGFDPLTDGAMIDVSVVGSALSVQANTTPPVVGSVGFTFDVTTTHTEDAAPYMLCSNNLQLGRIDNCHFSLGYHVVTATAFSQADQGGTAGPTATVGFTLFDSTSSDAGGGGWGY